jgi:hypothetical protein
MKYKKWIKNTFITFGILMVALLVILVPPFLLIELFGDHKSVAFGICILYEVFLLSAAINFGGEWR